ncbi:MAG: metallophosphoesterase [Pseudomonadota bacterium]|nr:metallophosphoesterase [Pseudomonadota bacterium]
MMIQRNFLLSSLTVALLGCYGDSDQSNTDDALDNALDNINDIELAPDVDLIEESVAVAATQFIAMGDSGTGSPGHYAVGQAIRDVCDAKVAQGQGACEFVMGFGDNIYEDGVSSVDDSQFIDKFEAPFAPIGELPFYMALGNHDNTGYVGGDGMGNYRGDFQVEYTYVDYERGDGSPRWYMPNRYYAINTEAMPTTAMPTTREGKPLLNIVTLDSNPIASAFADADARYSWQNYGMQQLIWAQDQLLSSDALFNVAIAHHPYLSNGSHGNAGFYDGIPGLLLPMAAGQRWKDFLEEGVCDYADYIMTGHDHDLQLLEPTTECGRTQQVVSGAAGKFRSLTDMQRNAAMFQRGDTYGFFWMKASEADPVNGTPAQMCMEVYTVEPESEGLGVLSPEGTLTPAYTNCLAKKDPVGIARGRDFSATPLAVQVPIAGENTEVSFDGIASVFRDALVSGLNQLNAGNPDENSRVVIADIIGGMDALLMSIDATASTLTGSNDDSAIAIDAIQLAAERLADIDTSTLPAPFDQLGSAFNGFAEGVGGTESPQGIEQDISLLLGPLVQLTFNLNNILDAVADGTESLPLLGGVTEVLSTITFGVSQVLSEVSTLKPGNGVEALVGSINSAFDIIVLKVLLLEQAPSPIAENAVLPGNLLSDVLQNATRDIGYQLDVRVLPTISTLASQLFGKLTNAVSSLLDGIL